MMTFTELAQAPSDPPEPFTDRLRLAVAAYLARFMGSSREHTESDLRRYLSWYAERGPDPLAAQRPHLELYIRWMQEIRRFKPSTVSRRFSVTAGFYRTCVLDGLIEHSPAEHVRRPAVPAESPTLGFTHLQFEALFTAARDSANPCDFALVAMLGLLGLRIFEATSANIADLGEEHGHRLLRHLTYPRRPHSADERADAVRRSLAPSYACPAPVAPGGQSMTNYARMYRFGITPWERYATAAAASIGALLDREETGRSRPLGRALDLGCGRGLYTPELARRGWEAVGIDFVPAAIEAAAAKSPGAAGLSYVVGDVTRLPSANLGTFDFFLDIGCFQGLDAGQRLAQGEGISALANAGATLLLLSFGPSRWRWLVEGASQEEVETAVAGWEMLTSEPADTAGLGWPMNKTAPRWYRLHRPA
jgi:SAM-dependent methyltransferase